MGKAEDNTLKLQSIIDCSRIGTWEWNVQTGETVFNDIWAQIIGYTLDELSPVSIKTWEAFAHPEDMKISDVLLERHFSGELPYYDTECRMKHKNGHWVWVHDRGKVVSWTDDGKPLMMYGTHSDISERKKSEQNQFMFSTLIQNSSNIFIVKDLDFRIVIANKAFIQAAGKKDITQLIGKTDAEIAGFSEESEPFVACRKDDIKATKLPLGEKLNREEILPVPGMGDRTFLTQKFPIRNELDRVIGIGVISTDITELKENEAVREKYNSKLNQIQKLESLGLLAGGIAHDFNNLMGGIFGYIDLAINEPDRNITSQYLEKAMSTIERSRDLTGQLLTFAKGGSPIQKIDHLFPFFEETARFALSGANVSCHFDVPQDLWLCNFDRNQIGQVVDNLIINAQQAMPLGGTIDITARNIMLDDDEIPALKKGNYIKISVKDYGIGIQKELIPKIFDPFFTTKTKGHGLGLASCYSIIKKHNGFIDVESEPGKGSIFHVYLPASTDSVLSVSDRTAAIHKGKGTFLIMDDEEVMRETIGDMLKSFGYKVISKENGRDAVDFFAAGPKAGQEITGMIFDLTIPGGMGGKAAVEEIRKFNKEIPIFVMSGYAEDSIIKNPVEHGFTASICKPFRREEISELLNRFI
jgi:PAS domain S-box-containing protein